MTLTYPLLDKPLTFSEERTNALMIEAPGELRAAVSELIAQTAGESGSFVLGIDDMPAEITRHCVLVTDPFSLQMDSRKLSAKLLQEAVRAAWLREEGVRALLRSINDFAAEISMDLDYDISYSPLTEPDSLLRILDYRPNREVMGLPEQLLEYMRMQRAFFDKRLFILFGLKAILRRDELTGFLRTIRYEKLDVLLLDAFQRGPAVEGEALTIIDEDLCILH